MNGHGTTLREHYKTVSSTNDCVKARRSEGKDLIVTAEEQTGGRGTKGRSFSSGKGGVYLSKLTFYENFPAERAFEIMAGAATAVCRTLRFFGLQPCIKWANDVLVNGKKICGILIENVFSGANVVSSVVGIGINVRNALPEELSQTATTMQRETGRAFSVEEVTRRLIDELSMPASMDEYLSFIGYIGRQVTLIVGDERIPATILSVDKEGALWVETQGEKRRYYAAEVSVRL